MRGWRGDVYLLPDTGDAARDAVADPIPFLSEEDECFFRASEPR